MRPLTTVSTLAMTTAGAIALLCLPADSQTGGSFIALQGQTPGNQQLGNANISGTINAAQFAGGGAGLIGVNAAQLGGQNASSYLQQIPFPLTLIGWSATQVIRGETDSYYEGATGVKGIANSYSAVFGTTFGVVGESNGWYACGVQGKSNNTAGQGFGLWGVSASSSGYGVLGQATSGSGYTYGGWFGSASTSGDGVVGQTTAGTGVTYAVVGEALSTSGRGVFGSAPTTTGFAYGVLGQTAPPHIGYAVFANGDMGASGLKPFRIDHPFDPENKYLLHYSTESPSPQNFYSGNVFTDPRGYAWVELPDYFAEINKNFKYQLTVVSDGKEFVQAMVSKKIVGNRFQIRTSAPSTEVSWRIEADRNDLYAQTKHPKDVMEKVGVERGTYQHPELYGMSKEMGLNYRPEIEPLAKRTLPSAAQRQSSKW